MISVKLSTHLVPTPPNRHLGPCSLSTNMILSSNCPLIAALRRKLSARWCWVLVCWVLTLNKLPQRWWTQVVGPRRVLWRVWNIHRGIKTRTASGAGIKEFFEDRLGPMPKGCIYLQRSPPALCPIPCQLVCTFIIQTNNWYHPFPRSSLRTCAQEFTIWAMPKNIRLFVGYRFFWKNA